ncbi:MAG TPA: TonB-dependent receptor [Thiobacillus sp.]|nr:TonB-dependent receptor [Thiobacillus sp.]
MKMKPIAVALASLATLPAAAEEQALLELTIRASPQPAVMTSNPSPQAQVTQAQIREINVINVEDSLKYTPSLFIRKRYVGDTNGIVATRTTGSLQSALSLVYVDGLLLSNLLGNSFSFPPRWNLVGAEEIDTIDVLHGPFSALLPGNSAGATVLMTTRTPERFEAHARAQGFSQPSYKEYATDDSYSGHQEQVTLGSRVGKLGWSLLANHLDSDSQPINFATATVSSGTVGVGTPVNGAVLFNSATNAPSVMFGATSLDHTVQDTAKIRLTYDFTASTRGALTYGYFRNDSFNDTRTYLTNAATGAEVWGGTVNIGGLNYNVGTRLAPSDSNIENTLLGLSLNSRLSPDWRVEFSASDYRTPTDMSRTPTTSSAAAQPGAAGGAGRISFGDGTGWRTFDARAIRKPRASAHELSFGYHFDRYHIESQTFTATNWKNDASIGVAPISAFEGDTRTDALFIQDAWKFDPRWTLTAGVRQERWQALDGVRHGSTAFLDAQGNSVNRFDYARRDEDYTSPKLSLTWRATPDWQLRASVARAYRMPTVSELFQTETRAGSTFISDPNLKPEKILATDLSAEGAMWGGNLRLSVFDSHTDNALYSQTDSSVSPNVTNVQNIDRVRVTGAEVVYDAQNWLIDRLDVSGSVTYADSEILSNDAFPASVGKDVPRIPVWRASVFATYRFDAYWSGSLGARYSGLQYGRLDNLDTNHDDTGGVGSYTVVDARVGYRFNKLTRVSLGVDNLNNAKYFIGPHPFPQRTWHGELRIDY